MKLAYMGTIGSYAHLAAQKAYPHHTHIPFPTFEDALDATHNKTTDLSLIPLENSTMGRVADIHHILPETPLTMVAEHYLPIQHALLTAPTTQLSDVTDVYSQLPALTQCRHNIKQHGFTPHATADTAGAAKMLAARPELAKHSAAIASSLAGETYGLKTLIPRFNDQNNNTTRFITFSRQEDLPPVTTLSKTALLFTVKSIPAALHKALGCFADTHINLTKLESYLTHGQFTAAQFYAEIESHQQSPAFKTAHQALTPLTENIKILGTFPLNPPK